MKKLLDSDSFNLIVKEMSALGYTDTISRMKPDDTYYVGITVADIVKKPDGTYIRYVEDDAIDSNGNPYIFEYIYLRLFGILKPGTRMISIYYGNSYLIIPVNGSTYTLIGAADEERIRGIDFSKCTIYPTPLVLSLDKGAATRISETQRAMIKRSVLKYAKYKTPAVIGTVVLCFLTLLLVFLAYIFTFAALDEAGNMSDATFLLISVAAVVVLACGIYGSVRFFRTVYLKNVLRKKFIKKVMYVNTRKDIVVSASMTRLVYVYEWEGDTLKYLPYHVGPATAFLSDDISFGDVIYLISGREYASAEGSILLQPDR